jgi:UDP-N-acetylmuramyl pentapeptide phosphotransferase/UDP-N-acetylglucosamine-1-phosphate transferase
VVENLYFLLGLTLICGVSLWDDISSLPNRVRIIVHFLSISLVFFGLGIFTLLPWWLITAAYILFVGVMNAYNFMDGINGITGLYSLTVLLALQYVNYQIITFTSPDFIYYAILACLVFLFFNFRKRAKCFAGDVGSLGISFWIVTLLLQLMLASGSCVWIFFLSVYGVDSVATILHRLYLKQNIFKAHRMHFYQVLSNERGISHRKVAGGYAFVQLLICGIIVYSYEYYNYHTWIIGTGIVGILSLIYLTKLWNTDDAD